MVQCKERIEDRIAFLEHKLRDITHHETSSYKHREQVLLRLRQLHQSIGALNQTHITISGFIDSVVTMSVMRQTEQVLASTIVLSVVEDLMASLEDLSQDVNDISQTLAEPYSSTTNLETSNYIPHTAHSIILPTPPSPPTTEPTHHARRSTAPIG